MNILRNIEEIRDSLPILHQGYRQDKTGECPQKQSPYIQFLSSMSHQELKIGLWEMWNESLSIGNQNMKWVHMNQSMRAPWVGRSWPWEWSWIKATCCACVVVLPPIITIVPSHLCNVIPSLDWVCPLPRDVRTSCLPAVVYGRDSGGPHQWGVCSFFGFIQRADLCHSVLSVKLPLICLGRFCCSGCNRLVSDHSCYPFVC